ncbi:MAG TPA: HAMP domain-containing sensor histidine kinase [Gemmatimonadales bacterium]|nr:HAMP domain-containing sensor histidine kinase [Gemmatimonadales bacterium]
MSERRLSQVLTRRFRRLAWTALAGYALVVVLLFGVAAEMALRRSLEHTADVTQSLLGAYRDSTTEPGGVMPSALADQLVGMGGQVVITRTRMDAGGVPQVFYLSPDMPARRLEGLPADSPERARAALVAAITERTRWRYRVLHRALGEFDVYVVASRESYVVPLGILAVAAAVMLPLAAFVSARGARSAVAEALKPLDRVTTETRAIGPSELGTRLTIPTGQAEVTELAESIDRMLERVDRAHRALQAFTADASHELRTPLTHLRAQVQWASQEGRSTAEMREALVAMERGLDRTTKLVEELLLIARGENRQLALAHAPFDLGAVVEEVREITEAMAVEKKLEVRATPADPARAIGDAHRTRHILLNLASNAVRYTAAGSITFATVRNGTEVGVRVRDTGPGIAPEHVERIFDRFFRIDQSRSRELGGTGLGLAIARLLAELQGGRITVESTVGQGSTFTLWLPAA